MGLMTAGGGLSTSKLALANAATGDVLTGKEFYAGDKTLKTGTMANQGTKNATIAPGGSYTIPKGFHSGSGKVTANKERDLQLSTSREIAATQDGWYIACSVATQCNDKVNPDLNYETNGSNVHVYFDNSTGNSTSGNGNIAVRVYLKKGQYIKITAKDNAWGHYNNTFIVYQG